MFAGDVLRSSALAPPELDALERRRVLGEVCRALFATGEAARLGRFQIMARIGSGATGVVYQGHDPELDRRIALKVLGHGGDARIADDPRLLREAQALARLTHPNVVTIHEVGREAGRIFIAMELVDGQRLDDWLAAGARDWKQVLDTLLEAGAGIAAAHAAGLVHRDIKPSNIMVDRVWRARVVDFGLARAEAPDGIVSGGGWLGTKLTGSHALVGTPAYASPEQLQGRPSDSRSDQYGFAATAWEALAGSAPFAGETIADRLAAIRAGVTRTPRLAVPARVLDPLRRALRFEPAERYESLSALLSELKHAALASNDRGRRRSIAIAIASGVAVVAMAAWAIGGGRTAERRADANGTVADRTRAALARSDAVLACPVFEAEGVEAPTEWLGAAAASLACRRAVWTHGGREERVLLPAALLGLPMHPTEEVLADPWARPETRQKTLDAARRRAAAWLDGRVVKHAEKFTVTLLVETADEKTASVTAEASLLHLAVRGAMERLESAGALSVASVVDPEVAKWTDVRSPIAGALLAELGPALEATVDQNAPCKAVEPYRPMLGHALARALRACDTDGSSQRPDVPLDRSSPEALAKTAPLHFSHPARLSDRELDVARRAVAVAAQLAAARKTEASAIGKRVLQAAEASALQRAGRSEQATSLLLDLAARAPSDFEIHRLHQLGSADRHNARAWAVHGISWSPDVPTAWAWASWGAAYSCPGGAEEACTPQPERWTFQRHSFEIGPLPEPAMDLALRLLERGRIHETRTLGAQLRARGDDYRSAAEDVLGLADAREGWLGRGYERMRAALLALEVVRPSRGDLSLLSQTVSLSEVVGKRRQLAEEVAKRFVLSEPSRLPRGAIAGANGNGWWGVDFVWVCMEAPRAVALACIARIREREAEEAGWTGGKLGAKEFLDGAERYASGDLRAAAAAWRALAVTGYYGPYLPVEAFDRSGDDEIVKQLEAPRLRPNWLYAGIHPAVAREARRAEKHGDRERARRLATRVVEAWGVADVPIPAVAEMRALLARLR
jgi:hypothetical protein